MRERERERERDGERERKKENKQHTKQGVMVEVGGDIRIRALRFVSLPKRAGPRARGPQLA